MVSQRFQSSGRLVFHAFVILTLAFLVGQSMASSAHSRHNRSVLSLCRLMEIFTPRSCLDYNGYGCYCGYGGSERGVAAVDGVDRCCKIHDACYDGLDCWPAPHIYSYKYECRGTNCRCLGERGCSRSKCECDLRFAQCLSTQTYNPRNKNYKSRGQC